MKTRSPISTLILFLILAAAIPVSSQIKAGDDVLLNLNGNVGVGYSGTYGDLSSSHGISAGGNADLSGSYYSPQFLSFHVSPYVNQSRENSNFDSITTTSGIHANASIFSGSHFPGWVNYSRTFDSASNNYSVPGLANFNTHGDSDSLGLGWSESVPGVPSFSVGYQQANGEFEPFGSIINSQVHSRIFNLTSSYHLDGFNLNGGFHDGTNDTELPSTFLDGQRLKSDTSNISYYFGADHRLPLRGAAAAHFSSTSYSFGSQLGSNDGKIDTVDATATLNPANKLSLDANFLYTDNLVGTLFQTILGVGGTIQTATLGWDSNSWVVGGDAVYSITPDMRLIGRADHRQQDLGTNTYSSDSLGGVFSYFRLLWGGRFTVVQAVTGNTVPNNVFQNQDRFDLGLSSSASYARSVGPWNLSGMFIFNRNQATSLIAYTANSYSYSGNFGRNLRRFYWSVNASGSQSSFGSGQGSDTRSQSYSTSLSTQKVGISGSYSHSSGTAIQTPTGLAPTPLPLPVLPTAFITYGGDSYSIGAGGSPVRGLSFTGSFVKTVFNTTDSSLSSRDNAELANFYMQHQFRKVNFHAGYTHVLQGFSVAANREVTVNSYYFGISRWFNFF